MTLRRRHISVLAALAVLAVPAFAQTTVRAFTDKTTMGDGEVLVFTVEASGGFGDLDRIAAPETRGLVAVQTSPVQSWAVSSVNGVTRQKLTLQWQYRPLGTGTAYLGEATLRLDGRDYSTDPVVVTVVDQASRPAAPLWNPRLGGSARPDLADAGGVPDLFIRAEPSATEAFVGEQVVVDYVLYFEAGVQPRNSRILSAWDADGFWREDLELDRFLGSTSVEIDGRTFEAVPIKRLAVFPTRSGRLQVDSLDIEVDVLRASRSRRQSPFSMPFGSRFERETVTAPPVVVEVQALPPGAPPSFAGAVGAFTLDARPDRREVAVGEPVRVTATVVGHGNIATLGAPGWAVPSQFEQYPVREAERIERHRARLQGEKTYTYTLVPRSGGSVALPPVTWSYFEPDAEEYRTLRSDSLRLRVIGPATPLAETAPTPDADRLAGPAERAVWQPQRTPRPLWATPLFWGAVGLPTLALLALVAVARRRERDEDTAYARSLRAFPVAERGLREADALGEAGDVRALYAALARTLHTFLADRLDAPTHGVPYPDLDRTLGARGVTTETRAALIALLRESDAAQFAPHAGSLAAHPTRRAAGLMADVDAEADTLEDAV